MIEAQFDNPEGLLRPGMFGTARIVMAGDGIGVFVPVSAVITDPTTNSSSVYVIKDGVARLHVVQIGERENDMVRIFPALKKMKRLRPAI